MTKAEAITTMKNGSKVTHDYFSRDEYVFMENGEYVLEDGVRCSPDEFWSNRQVLFENGWSIFTK